jgi:carbon storage regulator
MLVLTRRTGEAICIGDNIRITVYEIRDGSKVRLAIDAPKDLPVHRKEVYDDIEAGKEKK